MTLLVDVHLDGHAELLERQIRSPVWMEISDHLDIRFVLFDQVGIDRSAKDDFVWRYCQERGYYLLTANRNDESDDSLEATIRREGGPQSLPVFTFGDADRIYHSAKYLDQIVESLLEFLMDEVNIRGAGRLYLP